MTDKTGKREFTVWVDIVRVAAIYLVVVVHVSGQLTNVWGQIPPDQWLIANVYGGIARICVPLFFMISGYLLLPRSESLSDFYAKRIPKILVPLVVWSLIYLGWYCGNHQGTCTPGLIWDLVFVKGTYYHLWFLYTLLGIYLVMPVLRLMTQPGTDRKLLWYLIVLWLIFQPLLTLAHKFWNFSINLSAPLATGYASYFVFGYLLGEITLSRSRVLLSAAGWVVGTLGTITGTYLLTRAAGQFDGFFYDFVTLNVILASGAAFILLRWLSEAKMFVLPAVQTAARVLAAGTFGIYLVHVMVIEILSDWIPFLHMNSFMGNAIWSIPLVSTVVFLLSFLLVHIIQKVPILKSIVP